MTIEDLMNLQASINSGHVHIVYIGEKGWTIAHTDDERAEGFDVLLDCDLNDWLEGFETQPVPTGIYAALEEEWDGWELVPVDLPENLN